MYGKTKEDADKIQTWQDVTNGMHQYYGESGSAINVFLFFDLFPACVRLLTRISG